MWGYVGLFQPPGARLRVYAWCVELLVFGACCVVCQAESSQGQVTCTASTKCDYAKSMLLQDRGGSRVATVLSSAQAGVVGLLKGSQVARFALPAPEASTAASSSPAVPASSSPVQYVHPTTPQLGTPAGTPIVSQPPPAKTPKDPAPKSSSQHEAASSASTHSSLASASGQQSRHPHRANDVSSTSAQTDSAIPGTQAGASTSGRPVSHLKSPPLSEQASTERQLTASHPADQAVSITSDPVKADSVRPAFSMDQPQEQQQPAASSAMDGSSAGAVNVGFPVGVGDSDEAAIAPQVGQSEGSAHIEGGSGAAETVASDTAGSPVGRSESQREAAGAELGSASRPFDRAPAHSTREAEQAPIESSDSEAGSALRDQHARLDPEADADVQTRSPTVQRITSELTGTDAQVDSSLVPGNKSEGKQQVASLSNAARGSDGTQEGSKDHMSLHDSPADASTAAGSASEPPSGDQAGPDESELQGGEAAQQQLQQVTEQAAAELLQSSAQRTDHDAVLSGRGQQMPSVRPPVLAREEDISKRSMQEGSVTSEEAPRGAASTSAAPSKQTQGDVAGAEGSLAPSTAVEFTSGKQAAAMPASGKVDSPKPPASLEGEENRSVAPTVPPSRVSTVRSDAPFDASRSSAVSSSATARSANKHLNESQEKETEAQVLSPKGSVKSRQTVEMKRQQTSFNPLG